MDVLSASISWFELPDSLSQFVYSFLTYFASNALFWWLGYNDFGWRLGFLCLFWGLGYCCLTWVLNYFLFNIEVLVKELQIYGTDLFLLTIQQFEFVFFVLNIFDLNGCSCHLFLHGIIANKMNLHLLVLVHNQAEGLIKTELFRSLESWGSLKFLPRYTT